MDWLLPVFLILAGFYVGWNIGANDAANCIGTTVGARVVSYRTAALLMSVFVIVGGVFQGHRVMKTVGKGIVITTTEAYEKHNGEPPREEFREHFPDERLSEFRTLRQLLEVIQR